MFESAVPEEIEQKIWKSYFMAHVQPELIGRFVERWIEIRVGDSYWSSKKITTTIKFDRTNMVRLVEPLQMPFPCLEGEAEFAALFFGKEGCGKEGYSRRWTAHRSSKPYWYCWEDYMTMLPARTLLMHKRLTKFIQEGRTDKRRRLN